MTGRTAIVTGAGQGMGRAIALALSEQGASVAAVDIDESSAAAVADEITRASRRAISIRADVSRRNDVNAMVAETIEKLGPIHILVNNAGVLRGSRVSEITEDEWDFVVDINLKGTFLCSQAVLPSMQGEGWGRIINLSSTAGKSVSTIGGAHYTAAKAGVLGFTRHLAKEVASHGITVNAVCPGLIDTEMVRASITPEKAALYAASFPIGRLGSCEEVAALAGFLCTKGAAYITGASLDINGGDLTI